MKRRRSKGVSEECDFVLVLGGCDCGVDLSDS